MNAPGRRSVIYDFDPRNLPSDLLKAIGLITAAAAQTESVMRSAIGGLLGLDDVQSNALATHMTVPLKDQVIRTLAELQSPHLSELDKIDELLDNVLTSLDKRNIAVHGSLARDPETGQVLSLRITARGSLQLVMTPIAVGDVEKDAALIYEAGMSLMHFLVTRGLLPANRTKQLRIAPKRGHKARERRRNS